MSNIKAGCKESVKLFNGIKVTNRAVSILTTEYKVNLENLTAEELKKLLIEAKEDKNIMVDGNYEDAVWTEYDIQPICCIDGMDDFCKIEELKIYVTSDLHDGEYYLYGEFGDASVFLDCYVGLCECDDAELANKTFNENLNDIYWYDEENELKQAVDNILNQIKDEIEGEDVILLSGSGRTSLENEIKKLVDYNEADYEVMGYYSGEEIYRIKNKLYYLTDDSYTCNYDYYWKLQELGPKGYEHFKMK
ncbi:MAG: hypothetical protein LLF98_11205 [Clostridium sp.]|uniref:hypothetical protein n=1 Tax=Clostridium sp. TaxID=1506 RepID=UPI0025C45911|nr:hypothetical protein [Clostridium sp.]MCE5221797.1 hypothetical protein [Clostridium sp.]